jgi:hypothetical protein
VEGGTPASGVAPLVRVIYLFEAIAIHGGVGLARHLQRWWQPITTNLTMSADHVFYSDAEASLILMV